MESPSATLLRLMKRRVPPEKRQRTEMSCDYCKRKKCKCLRPAGAESCRACNEIGQSCTTTKPRKRRMYPNFNALSGSRQIITLDPVDAFHRNPSPRRSSMHGVMGTARPLTQVLNEELSPTGIVHNICETTKGVSVESLFEDSLGLPRYIGPIGSYTLLVKLWEIMDAKCAFIAQDRDNAQTMGQSMLLCDSNGQSIDLPPRKAADMLVILFFEKVHCDFPIFHRALFQESYEGMWSLQPNTEPAWLMSLSMVFVLGLEVAPDGSDRADTTRMKEELKKRYLSKAKDLLPEVIAGATLSHVQALMLYSRYLHITRNRNASWNIVGAAIRLAVAIGLHRNGNHAKCSPLERELRKRVWWTLHAFERIECSSLGRTSAIDDDECNVGRPTEGMLDMSDTIPLGYVEAQAELMKMLGSICKHQYGLEELPQEQVDFAIKTLVDLDGWYGNLPSHLMATSKSPRTHSRAILLLHVQYHYTITLLCRPFLVSLTTKPVTRLSNMATLSSHAKTCITSAKAAVSILNELFSAGLFNSKTWWDVYYVESICMILAIGRFVEEEGFKNDPGIMQSIKTCVHILEECKEFSPTMQRFAKVTTDFAQALVYDSSPEAQQFYERHQPDFSEDLFPGPLHAQATEAAASFAGPGCDHLNTGDAASSHHDPFAAHWDIPDMSYPDDWADVGFVMDET
ncbi:fungal-specific transcription factor domain-containing protein [Exophiala viscosa]|uniref:fungal-specific transcription factor domain-containing protein n=1 Tax=Exophiala viscosa TaxID=2486360 RepID=UPI0021A0A5A6|nr:fungal-specific transcription factor domain-containing protein [Exophiala viscosa]